MIVLLVCCLIILGLMGLGSVLLVNAPYHFYQVSVERGLQSHYLSMQRPAQALLKGSTQKLPEHRLDQDAHLWESLHFEHFNLPIPIDHPVYQIIPRMESSISGRMESMGMYFNDQKSKPILAFLPDHSSGLVYKLQKDRLFELPYFKNYIFAKSLDQVWQDMFERDLTAPIRHRWNVLTRLAPWKQISYQDLVYNLFILHMRNQFFPANVEHISFYPQKNMGLLKLKGDFQKDQYQLYFYQQGMVYRLQLNVWKEQAPYAQLALEHFIESAAVKEGRPEDSVALYAQFRKLSYSDKITQKGMVYLYSAWTHDSDNKGFLKEMIQFLERGKQNEVFLMPLYDFAYKRYKTNFSLKLGQIKEDPSEKIKRKSLEELQQEVERERYRDLSHIPSDVNNDERRIEYYLKSAKGVPESSDPDAPRVLKLK